MINTPDCQLRRSAARSTGGTRSRWLAVVGMSIAIGGTCASAPVHAQATADRAAPSDRAKRDADKVYELIRMHADRPRKASSPPAGALTTVLPSATNEVRQSSSPAVVNLTATPDLPASPVTARDAGSAPVEFSARAPVAALAPPTAPLLATELAVKPLAPALAATADRSATPAATETLGTTLVLVSGAEPEFPAHLIRRLGQGSVVVAFEVRPDGSVGATSIQKSRHAGLNDAAMAAVAAWRFKPVSATTAGVTEFRFE